MELQGFWCSFNSGITSKNAQFTVVSEYHRYNGDKENVILSRFSKKIMLKIFEEILQSS